MNKRLPTDRELLRCIYDMYAKDYPGPLDAAGKGKNDPYLEIDIKEVGRNFDCPPELLFGRLYYHLDAKHRYRQDDGKLVPFFIAVSENLTHAIHWPYMASVLATLDDEHRRHLTGLAVSILALALSLGAIVAQIATSAMSAPAPASLHTPAVPASGR